MIYLHVWLRWVVVAAWGLLLVVGSRAHSLGAVLRFHIVVTSLVGHWLAGTWASAVAAQRLSTCSSWAPGHRLKNCGAQAQPLHSMWNLPDQALNPCLLRWWGGFLTTWPPGKSCSCLNCLFFFFFLSCKSSWYILDKWSLLRSFRSLIHFELIFVHCVPWRKASQAKRRIKTHECHPTPCSLHRHWELWARGSQTPTCASHRYLQPQNQLGNFQNSNIQTLQILIQEL